MKNYVETTCNSEKASKNFGGIENKKVKKIVWKK